MSDLVWSIKNGDLESVKDSIEKKVSTCVCVCIVIRIGNKKI